MGKKINRNYQLTIQDVDEALASYYNPLLLTQNKDIKLTPANNDVVNNIPTYQQGKTSILIKPPFTIEVEITSAINAGENIALIRIHNLNAKTRDRLFQATWTMPTINGAKHYRKVLLEGGYGTELSPIFIGILLEGYSFREGTEEITQLKCVSSAVGLYNAYISQSYNQNVSYNQVINDIIQNMIQLGDIEKGAITVLDGNFTQGTAVQGESFNLLSQFGVQVFIDLGKINILKLNEVIGSIAKVPEISSNTGLLGTPIFAEGFLMIDIIFEPTIRLGSLVQINSTTFKWINAQYKVIGITHKGIFSGTKEGKLITTLKLWMGNLLTQAFTQVGT